MSKRPSTEAPRAPLFAPLLAPQAPSKGSPAGAHRPAPQDLSQRSSVTARALLAALALLSCGPQPPPAGRQGPPAIAPPPAPAPAAAPEPALDLPAATPRPPLPLCDDALPALQRARARARAAAPPLPELGDLAPLAALLAAVDAELARDRAAALTAALAAAADPAAAIDALAAVDAAIALWLRERLRRANDPAQDPASIADSWHLAECAWDLLRPDLAAGAAQEGLGPGIAAAFADGRRRLAGPPDGLALALGPERQRVEKRLFTAAHRQLLADAARARATADRHAARRAAAAFALLADRLDTKNTPGIAVVEAALAGDPAAIEPAVIAREVAVAIAKRARKYCSEPIAPGLPGTPAGRAAAVEGATYARLLLPDMEARLAPRGFDRRAHLAAWDAFVAAVDDGDDDDELRRLSDELVHWNCAYQQALGVRECTATQDEPAARP